MSELIPFWRREPLTEAEARLWRELAAAHDASARRENLSWQSALACAAGSGEYTNGICGALLALGGIHAPLKETLDVVLGRVAPEKLLGEGKRVPGWGNSFVKGMEDPMWDGVKLEIDGQAPALAARIAGITAGLHASGRDIYPNPSCWTAAAAIVLRLPESLLPYLFIRSRLDAWTEKLWRSGYVG